MSVEEAKLPRPRRKEAARSNRRGRTEQIAAAIKRAIVEDGLRPGDRLPQEHELIAQYAASKGTIREALRSLAAEGLVRTRTGPGGGAFITEVDREHAMALLSSHLLFTEVSISHIYELRIALEPEMVRDLTRQITAEQIAELEQKMSIYTDPPTSISEERKQRAAELEFHEALARFSDNPLISFVCGFLVRLLKDLTVCKRIYERPLPELRERGLSYQEQLIAAFRERDPAQARAVMKAHMRTAQRIMVAQEAEVTKGFLTAE